MSRPILYGQPFQPNVQSIVFALAEKDVAYHLEPKRPLDSGDNILKPGFGEPVLEVAGYRVEGAETVLRFIADEFAGPSLQPDGARERARMNRAIEINYREAVTTLGSRIAGRYLAAIVTDEWFDPDVAESTLADARRTVAAFEDVIGNDAFFAGSGFSIADIAVGPIVACLMQTPPGERVIAPDTRLRHWWERVSARNAFRLAERDSRGLFGFLTR